MTRRLLFSISLFSCALTFAQPLIWDMSALNDLRTQTNSYSYRQIVQYADKILEEKPVAVTDKEHSRSEDKHNFESLSLYYWPDTSNPNGPYVVKDGQANPEYKKYDLPRLSTLNHNTHYLAKAYYLTREDKYYDAFLRQIDAWFISKASRMNPNFEYAQFIPGKNNGKGCAAGLIDSYNFIDVVECIRLVDDVQSIGKKREKKVKKWVENFSTWMIESEQGQGAKRFTNNIGLAYDITLYYMMQYCGKEDELPALYSEITNRIDAQISENGMQPAELKRTKAFSYSIYNLQHIVDFSILQQHLGNDFLKVDGVKVTKALQYLNQFIGKKSTFPYQEIGNWEEQEKRLQNLLNRAKL